MADSNEYNNEPVFYCEHCLSLRIKSVPGMEELDYCDKCGSTDIKQTDIETWKQLYKEKNGFFYLDKF